MSFFFLEIEIFMKKVNQKKIKQYNNTLRIGKTVLLGVLAFCVGILVASGVAYLMQHFPSSSSDSELDKFTTAYTLLKDNWYYGKDDENLEERLIEQAIAGMATFDEDHHTTYFDTERSSAFSQSLEGSAVGIGALITTLDNGHLVVKDVYVNSASDQGGLLAGDEIVLIDHEDTSTASLTDWVDRIKTYEGKDLEIQVLRNGEEKTLTLVPSTFDSTVTLQNLNGVGLVGLSSFSQDSGKDFVEAVQRLKEQNVSNLILDLRDNTGGYLIAANQIASILLPSNSVIFKENLKNGTQQEVRTSEDSTPVEFEHIYILQNDKSASASEVLIGALKENMPDKVTTIGTTTFGKGSEQITLPFEDGSALKYTIAEWTTPNGNSVNGVGLAPDIEVKEDEVYTVSYIMPSDEELEAWMIQPDTVHPNAKAVQVYLRALGYPAERSDTYFSVGSSEAFKQFQQDNGLEPTGIVDKDSFLLLSEKVSAKLRTTLTNDDPDIRQALLLINPEQDASEQSDQTTSDQTTSESQESIGEAPLIEIPMEAN